MRGWREGATRGDIEDEDHILRAEGSPDSQGTEETKGIVAEHTPSEIMGEERGDKGEGKRGPLAEDRTSADTADSTDEDTANSADQETDTLSAGTATTLGPLHWFHKKKGKAGWAGPKHTCGLCNRPMRRGQGAVQCG